jgi:hypothetical protein
MTRSGLQRHPTLHSTHYTFADFVYRYFSGASMEGLDSDRAEDLLSGGLRGRKYSYCESTTAVHFFDLFRYVVMTSQQVVYEP